MKQASCAFLSVLLLLLSSIGWAQPYPSESEAVLLLQLRTFDKAPIPKMQVTARAGAKSYSGVTDKSGDLKLLVPVGASLDIDVGDSAAYDHVDVVNKPWQMVRHTVYYYGSVNGKMLPVPTDPSYAAQRNARPGTSRMVMTFVNRKGQTLEGEEVTVSGSRGDLKGITDAQGKVTFVLETGIPYVVKVKYNQHLHDLNLKPIYYGTGESSITYQYAGSKAIEAELNFIRSMQDTVVLSSVPKTPVASGTVPAGAKPSFAPVKVNAATHNGLMDLARGTGGHLFICNPGQEVVASVHRIISSYVEPKADVFILLDVSGSMTDNIAALKQSLEVELKELATRKGIRVGIAGFDEFITDGVTRDKWCDFSTTISPSMSYLKSIEIYGGNEQVYDACAFAITKPSWQSTNQRVLIVLGDEPPAINPSTGIDEKKVKEMSRNAGVEVNIFPVLIGGY